MCTCVTSLNFHVFGNNFRTTCPGPLRRTQTIFCSLKVWSERCVSLRCDRDGKARYQFVENSRVRGYRIRSFWPPDRRLIFRDFRAILPKTNSWIRPRYTFELKLRPQRKKLAAAISRRTWGHGISSCRKLIQNWILNTEFEWGKEGMRLLLLITLRPLRPSAPTAPTDDVTPKAHIHRSLFSSKRQTKTRSRENGFSFCLFFPRASKFG